MCRYDIKCVVFCLLIYKIYIYVYIITICNVLYYIVLIFEINKILNKFNFKKIIIDILKF